MVDVTDFRQAEATVYCAPDLTMPDFKTMTLEEIAAWAMEEPEAIPLHLFPLHCDAGRQGFLREFYNVGEGAIFAACSHVWASLAAPQAARCTAMGLAAGTGGTGKKALLAVLQKFLGEALAINNPIPACAGFTSLDEWHQAAMRTFAQDEQELVVLLKTYSAVLDGEPAPKRTPRRWGKVVAGPWLLPSTGEQE